MTASELSGHSGSAGHSEPSEARQESSRPFAERVLDLLVYLPAGALLTAMEDTSEAVNKGRTRVDQELRNAQFVGRFAVDLGWRRLKGQIESLAREVREVRESQELREAREAREALEDRTARGARTAPPSKQQPRRKRTAGTHAPAQRSHPASPAPRGEPTRGEPPRRGEPRQRHGTAPPRAEERAEGRGGVVARNPDVDRVIPDYDILAASQVVRRLDGLDPDELRAVLRHERATRDRRAIVQRAEEILGRTGSERERPTDTGSTD